MVILAALFLVCVKIHLPKVMVHLVKLDFPLMLILTKLLFLMGRGSSGKTLFFMVMVVLVTLCIPQVMVVVGTCGPVHNYSACHGQVGMFKRA